MTCFACGIVQIRLNIKKTGALLYAVGCSTYSVAQVNESAAYLFFANIRYLNNFFLIKSVLFLRVRLYCTKKSAQKNTLNGSVITIWRDFGKKCNILIWCQPYLLASFILLIVHIARYIPSLNEEKISRNMRLKSYQVIFFHHL